MAYVKTNWLDRLVQDPNKFSMVDNGDGTVTITEMPGNVYVEGTPVSAANLNKIENELVTLERDIANSKLEFATQTEANEGISTTKVMSPKRVKDTLIAKNLSVDTNLDSIKDPGSYYLSNSNSVTGAPSDLPVTSNALFLRVEASSNGHRQYQQLSQVTSDKSWVRSRSQSDPNGPWNSWKSKDPKIASYQEAQDGVDNEVLMTPLRTLESTIFKPTTINDLNELMKVGRYYYVANTMPLNSPEGMANQMTYVEVYARRSTSGDVPVQMLFQVSGAVYSRGRTSSTNNTWSQWRRLDTVVATQAEAQEGLENTKTMTPLRTAQAIQTMTLRKAVIARRGSSAARYIKIAEVDNGNATNARVSLLISGIGRYNNNYSGTAIVDLSARGGVALDVNVLSEAPSLTAATFTTINNSVTNKVELWFLSVGYQSQLEIFVISDNLNDTRVGSLDDAGSIEGNVQPRYFNKGGNLSDLTTVAKTDLVAAINEVNNRTQLATLAEAQDGTDNNKVMTPLRSSQALRYKALPETVTDFNDVLKPGFYSLIPATQAINMANAPSGITSNSTYLEVMDRIEGGRPVQVLYQARVGYVAIRGTSSSGWGSWYEMTNRIATSSDITAGTDDAKVMTVLRVGELIRKFGIGGYIQAPYQDANNIDKSGFYRLSSTALNTPTSGRAFNIWHSSFSASEVTQLAINLRDGKVFTRVKFIEDWTDWAEASGTVASQAEAQAGTDNTKMMTPLGTRRAITNYGGDKTQLQTSNKTSYVAAINEAFQFANNGKTGIGNVVGISPNQTFPQMVSHLQSQKDRLAANLNVKKVTASPTESLASLVDKVDTINTNHRVIDVELGTNPNLDVFTLNGGNTMNLAFVTVDTIDFKAKTVILTQDNGNGGVWTGLYQEGIFGGNYRLSNSSPSYTSALEYNLLTAGGSAYINDRGFKLPIPILGRSVRAQIIE